VALLAPTPYAVLADVFNSGMQQAAVGSVTTQQQQASLDAANSKIDSYIGAKFHLPLVSWGADLNAAAVSLAAFAIIAFRGFDPEDPGDKVFADRKDNTIKWLEAIADGKVTPVVVDSSPGGKGGAGADPFTSQARSQFSTTQAQLDGQVTVTGDSQSGQVFVSRPTNRGWY
jgi:phage gp36-like protein